jgi:hypothetical protein
MVAEPPRTIRMVVFQCAYERRTAVFVVFLTTSPAITNDSLLLASAEGKLAVLWLQGSLCATILNIRLKRVYRNEPNELATAFLKLQGVSKEASGVDRLKLAGEDRTAHDIESGLIEGFENSCTFGHLLRARSRVAQNQLAEVLLQVFRSLHRRTGSNPIRGSVKPENAPKNFCGNQALAGL